MTRHDPNIHLINRRKKFVNQLIAAMKRAGLAASLREQIRGTVNWWFKHGPGPIHPGVPRMAEWAGATERTAQTNLSRLRDRQDLAFLVPVAFEDGGAKNATHYLVDLGALFASLERLGGKPTEFMRYFCSLYGEIPEVRGEADPDFSPENHGFAQSDFTPAAVFEGSDTEAGKSAIEGAARGEETSPCISIPVGDATYEEGAGKDAPGSTVGAPSQPSLSPSRFQHFVKEEGFRSCVPREAAPPILPRPVDPQMDPAAPHGRAPDGRVLNWLGRPVSPDQWSRLSFWEKHGSTGLLFDALAGCWLPGCLCPD